MSWNLAISLFFGITTAFALVIGRARTVMVLLAAYAGLVVAGVGGSAFLSIADKLFTGATLFIVQTVIFGAITLTLVLKGEFAADGNGGRSLMNTIMTTAYGFLLAGLALSSVFSFMTKESLDALFQTSNLAAKVNTLHFWWVVLPVVLMVSTSFFSRPASVPDKK